MPLNIVPYFFFKTQTKKGDNTTHDYYDKVQSDLDTVAELGLAIGIEEPTIAESLKHYDELEIKDRNADGSFKR